jgi:antitoxin VapB
MNIKNAEVERLAEEVARLAGETKTEAIRKALEERRARLALRVVRPDRQRALLEFLQREAWPLIPPGQRGRRLTKEEEEELLGMGPESA